MGVSIGVSIGMLYPLTKLLFVDSTDFITNHISKMTGILLLPHYPTVVKLSYTFKDLVKNQNENHTQL